MAAAVFFQIPQQVMNGLVTGQQAVNTPSIINTAYGAGTLTNVFALPADSFFSTKTYYTIAFTTATKGGDILTCSDRCGAIGIIEMTFPAGFNVASAKLIQAENIGAGSLSVSGQTLKYTVRAPSPVPYTLSIQIMIGDITNAATTSNQVAVTTKEIVGANEVIIDGPTNSAPFTLVQVSNAMIGASAITAPKIAANSVDNTKIQDGQVTVADFCKFCRCKQD